MCPVESYDVTCMLVFRAALLALGNQLVFSSLGGPPLLFPALLGCLVLESLSASE